MELKNKKYNAITLVELIIALTMVSVLMVMMFGVIFKKTKASILSPTGTFYCWKDWRGNLHQKIVYSSGNRVVTEDSPANIEYCELNFPKYVTKDVNSIKAHVIGGGASGDYYNNLTSIPVDFDTDINIKLKNEASCYDASDKAHCIYFKAGDYNRCNDCTDIRSSNLDRRERLIEKCYVELLKSSNSAPKVYQVKNENGLDDYYYGNKLSATSLTCADDVVSGTAIFGAPFLYDRNSGELVKVSDTSVLKEARNPNIAFKAYTEVKFKIRTSSSTNNFFKSYDMTNKFDRNKILKIDKNDIGNPGTFLTNGDPNFNGSGGDTKLRAEFEGDPIDEPKKGIRFDNVGTEKRTLNNSLKYVKSTFNNVSSCCEKSSKKCLSKNQDTGLSQLVGLKNPKLPDVVYTCDEFSRVAYKILPDYSSNPSGFGLFGYNGIPNECKYEYSPFEKIKIYDSDVNTSVKKPSVTYCSKPNPGMGGAIIIQWN